MTTRPPAPPTRTLLRLLLEECNDYALLLLDREGTIIDWLAGATHIFGWSADEMVGQSVKRLFIAEDIDRGAADHELKSALAVGRMEDDRWLQRKDGTRIWVSGIMISLTGESDELIAYAKIIRERTEVKTQVDALEHRVKALQVGEKARQAFLGTVTHELRSPLSTLGYSTELIRRSGGQAPSVEAALNMIERQAAVMARLVDDLMDFTRCGASKLNVQLAPLELKEVLRSAADVARPLAVQRHQSFDVILIDGPVPVLGDRGRLQQVFGNLLRNAFKYTPADGCIWLKATTEGADAVVRVEDTGVGMDSASLPRVFDLFTQEKSSTDPGPGLSLVRELVGLHNGSVQARSDGRDKGSVFTVRIPLSVPVPAGP